MPRVQLTSNQVQKKYRDQLPQGQKLARPARRLAKGGA